MASVISCVWCSTMNPIPDGPVLLPCSKCQHDLGRPKTKCTCSACVQERRAGRDPGQAKRAALL